ncbi:Fic family protein [Paucibacter sp. M5-1]|uniref:Fic family protein n=1 Tax=Paucibacter sp. M5-1 TaxID=3015998 RepID=UPI003F81684E
MGKEILSLIRASGASGMAPDMLMTSLEERLSRSTLNRQLSALVAEGSIKPLGKGRSTRYVSTTPFSRAEVDAYFARPAAERPLAPFREELLDPTPNIDPERALRCTQIQGLAHKPDRKYLAQFLVLFAWSSSLLEGSTYSELDTEALIKYGERNPDKPMEDALLALNHKLAGQYLWDHRELSMETVCAMHDLLTDDHGIMAEGESDHFLPKAQRGRPREFEDVNLANSAYIPPFRPGTGHAQAVLQQIIDTSKGLPPLEAAVYLLTRIAYVQSFANGNKRTSRIAANAPLLAAGLAPFSFVDINKASYIRGMAAFYELGSLHVIEQAFIEGYARSIVRSSNLPAALRIQNDDKQLVEQLVDYVNSGKRSHGDLLRDFLTPGAGS